MASQSKFKEKTYTIIFKADTRAGKLFDVFLLFLIVLSLVVIMLESVEPIEARYGKILVAMEWGSTILFTLEYIARLYSTPRPKQYAFSFFGVIDLLSILPTWLELYFPHGHMLMAIRSIRLIRIFRVFNLTSYLRESRVLLDALSSGKKKITVFLTTVLTIVILMGTIMYQIEGRENGFTSIPRSMYWAVVTLTTVGYGDIAPKTPVGQFIASVVMILGYSIIAIPTGIVGGEIALAAKKEVRQCPVCLKEGHKKDAKYCYACGEKLDS